MRDINFKKGLAFISEGITEKVFYLEYIITLCRGTGLNIIKDDESHEDAYIISSGKNSILVLFNSVNSISQMPNSSTWFNRACRKAHPSVTWTVFLCYDTDAYNQEITKFYEGDWKFLRENISGDFVRIVDLAAKADIEDIMLCDYQNVLKFLCLPLDTPLPTGKKGKIKLKKLFRKIALNNAYHAGERALPLIQALDMNTIKQKAPINLKLIDETIQNC